MSDPRTPATGRERSTGPLTHPTTADAVIAARGVEWKAVPSGSAPSVTRFDDADLIEAFTFTRRRLPAWLGVVAGALLVLAVLAAIVLSVFTVSHESTRPVTPVPPTATSPSVPAPSAPLSSVPPSPQAPTPTPSAAVSLPPAVPAPPAPLPPVTATAETIATSPAPLPGQPGISPDTPVRDRLHDLFPRLFPRGGN